MTKNIFKKLFSNFFWFFNYLGLKIVFSAFLTILVGFLDSIGLSMFLPLLNLSNHDRNLNTEESLIKNSFGQIGLVPTLELILFLLVLFFILKGIAIYINRIYRIKLQQILLKKIRLKMLDSLNNVSYIFFSTFDSGRIQNTLTGEIDRIQRAFDTYFLVFQQYIYIIIYMGFALFFNPHFVILVLLGALLSNKFYTIFYKRTKKSSEDFTKVSNQYQGKIMEYIVNFKYLKSTGLVRKFSNRVKENIFRIEENRLQIGKSSAILESVREPLMIIIIAAVIYLETKYFNSELSSIFISLLFFYRALTALTQMQSGWNKFLEVSGSLNNLIEFQSSLQNNKDFVSFKPYNGIKEFISVESLDVKLGKKMILKNINLKIKKNQIVAFIGSSGSGKTTLFDLISGLISPSSGKILIDNESLGQIDKTDYQSKLGYIGQDSVIFNDTIFNNVTLWSDQNSVNLSRCINALENSSAWEFVKDFPDELNTVIGDKGIKLSGGQKQRISIARELYKKVEILLLDEATSALDAQTENNIQLNLAKLNGLCTILIIAHNLSTVKNVDNIYVLEEGKIIDSGSFKELSSRQGLLQKFVQLQQL